MLAILCALSILTMVLPNFTSTIESPTLSTSQFVFVGVVSLVLYVTFVFVQTIRHRDYFLPFEPQKAAEDENAPHAPPPSNGEA